MSLAPFWFYWCLQIQRRVYPSRTLYGSIRPESHISYPNDVANDPLSIRFRDDILVVQRIAKLFSICDDNQYLKGILPGSVSAVKQFSSVQGRGGKSQIRADRDTLDAREGTSAVTDATGLCLGGTWVLLGQALRCSCPNIWKGSRRTGKSGGKGSLHCRYILWHRLIFF